MLPIDASNLCVATWQVVSYAAMSIATLGNSPYFCDVNPTGGLQHRFYEVGAVHKMMALMNKQPSRRKQRWELHYISTHSKLVSVADIR